MTVVGAEGLSSAEVARRVGISYRQLDYQYRLGLVRPSVHEAIGTGGHHRWSDADVAQLHVVGRLMALGVGADVCRSALPLLREATAENLRWLVITKTPELDIAVVAEAELEDALAGSSATVVDLAAS